VLAGLLLSLGLGVPALLHARVAVVNEPSAAAEALYGLCLLGIDDATSRQRFERSLRLDPQHAVAWFGLGSAQLRLGQAAAARESARRALRLAPAWKSAQSLFRDASLRARTLVDFAPLLFFVPAVAIQLTSFQVLSKGPAEWVPRLVVGIVVNIAGVGVGWIIRRSRLAAFAKADPELAALLAVHGPGGTEAGVVLPSRRDEQAIRTTARFSVGCGAFFLGAAVIGAISCFWFRHHELLRFEAGLFTLLASLLGVAGLVAARNFSRMARAARDDRS